MDRMFQVLGFWCFVFALMFLAGEFVIPSILFFVQTVIFVLLGSLHLREKTYMYLFGGYMLIAFCGLVGYATYIS